MFGLEKKGDIYILKNDYYLFGKNYFGPFVNEFVNWIENQAKQKQIDTLWFLSRDSYIYWKVFERKQNVNINIYYFEVSKKSLAFPLMYVEKDNNIICKILLDNRMFSIYDVGSQFGMSNKDIENLLEEKNLNNNKIYDRENEEDQIEIIQIIKYIREKYKNIIEQQFFAFISYARQMIRGHKIGIIDVGWRGSCQVMMEKIFTYISQKVELYGLYLGLENRYNISGDGFLFNNQCRTRNEVMSAVALIELLGMQLSGTVLRYRDNNAISADRAPFEFLHDSRECIGIREIQQGAMDYFETDLVSGGRKFLIALSRPNKVIFEMFCDWNCFGLSYRPIIVYRKFKEYLGAIRKLKIDLNLSSWKSGYIYRYVRSGKIAFAIYSILKKIYN